MPQGQAQGRANFVLLSLLLLAMLAWWSLPSVSLAPNRIVPGTNYHAWAVAGWSLAIAWALPLAMGAWLCRNFSPRHARAVLALVTISLIGLPLWMTLASRQLVDPDLPQARLGIGASLWVLLFVLLLAMVELRSYLKLAAWQVWLCVLSPVVVGAICIPLGLDSLALWQEYLGRREGLYKAVVEHLLLVSATVVLSLSLGIAIALAIRAVPRLQSSAFAVLNFFQTVPSLALFGLLLGPLAWLAHHYTWLANLGVSGIGWAPALIALVIYSLLPMVRNTFVALEGVDESVIDAARGMGMSRIQIFAQVRVPLALPVMLEGVRITTVQAIGLAAVAALIGAGGLGRFIFQGLGQAAMDMVLLGALPILLMAVAADALLAALSRWVRRAEDAS
ncbi:ABC transporter permease [Halomonas binhaiensis]|uniref:ABC transporter permease n=1 Tax=Halomonas binhaiensis TaxID=2562282 RepID=A0A5C1NHP0_9GAMM|nr:ABC transporter permease [Halomonas binhaiensis]QEM81645.1 ABC transporter permease [Halomonas binhaiensis]